MYTLFLNLGGYILLSMQGNPWPRPSVQLLYISYGRSQQGDLQKLPHGKAFIYVSH